MSTIAGHYFTDSPHGRICVAVLSGGAVCHRRWLDIRNATSADIGKPHIAHIGNLTTTEAEQIAAERDREDIRIREATLAAAGYGIGGMAAGGDSTCQ